MENVHGRGFVLEKEPSTLALLDPNATVIIFDVKEKQPIFFNHSFVDFLGYNKEQILTMCKVGIFDFLLPNERVEVSAKFMQCLADLEPILMDFSAITLAGKQVICSIYLLPVADNDKKYMLCFFHIHEDNFNNSKLTHALYGSLRNITNTIPTAIATIHCNNGTNLCYANDMFYSILGFTKEETKVLFNNDASLLITPQKGEIPFFDIPLRRLREGSINRKVVIASKTEKHYASLCAKIIPLVEAGYILQCVIIDDKDRPLMDIEMLHTKEEIESIKDAIPGGFAKALWENDSITYIYSYNGLRQMAGYTDTDTDVPDELKSYVHPDDYNKLYYSLFSQRSNDELTVTFRILKKDGINTRWVESKSKRLEKTDNKYIYFSIYTDITALKEKQLKEQSEKERLALFIDATNDVFFEYNVKTDVCVLTSSSFLPIHGTKKFVIENYNSVYLDTTTSIDPEFLDVFHELCEGKINDIFEAKGTLIGDATHYTWFSCKPLALYDENYRLSEVIGFYRDIDEIKNAEMELLEKTRRDALTGILNRTAIEMAAKNCIENMSGVNNVAILLVNIDNFKDINDLLGFLYGDTVIKSLAERIALFFNGSFTGRIGGDEFLICVPDVLNEEELVNEATAMCSSFKNLYKSAREKFNPELSVGIAFSRKVKTTYTRMFEYADAALFSAEIYEDKKVLVYDSSMGRHLIPAPARDFSVINPHSENDFTPDELAFEILQLMIFTKDPVTAINTILAIVGNKYRLDRIYIYENYVEKTVARHAFEWCSENINYDVYSLKEEQYVHIGNYDHLFDKNGILCCSDVEQLKDSSPGLYNILKSQSVTALIQLPIVDSGAFDGFVSFDICNGTRQFTETEINNLAFISGALGTNVIKLRSQSELKTEHFLSQTIIDHMDLFVYSIDPNTYEITYVGKSLSTPANPIECGDICYEALRGRTLPCTNCPVLGISHKCSSYSLRSYVPEMDHWMDVTATKIRDYFGRDSIIITCHDVTNYVAKISSVDNLTSAPTQDAFKNNVVQLLADNPSTNYIMISLNLLKFRYINETYGYSAGNRMLVVFSDLIRSIKMPNETYGRSSSDKFILFLESHNNIGIENSVQALLNTFKDLLYSALGCTINYNHINFTAGIYYVENRSESVDTMYDKAVYAAKKLNAAHENSCAIYDANMKKEETTRRDIEANMKKALGDDEFKVYIQPKFSFDTLKLSGGEALIRWLKPDGTMIYPDQFIPIFESNGFVIDIDYFVYNKVCAFIRSLLNDNIKPPLISVNVSRAHICDDTFVETLMGILNKYSLTPPMLELELTESLFIDNTDSMMKIMNKLHNLGYVISIDDFGSGYSSLNLLKDYSVDILKLDKSFFLNNFDENTKAIIGSIVSLAKHLDIKLVCEGVETEEMATYLKSIKCDYAQGFLYARPMPMEQFEKEYIRR